MQPTMRSRLVAVSLLLTLVCARNLAARTFTIAPGSPTVPAAGPPNCAPPFSAFGDLLQGPPFFVVPTSVVS